MRHCRRVISFRLRLPWPRGTRLLCTAGYGPGAGSPYHSDERNAFYALDFDKPWRGDIMPTIPILAAADGDIVHIGADSSHSLGFHIILEHEREYRTLYAHLRDAPCVSGRVLQGQVIGYLGESGSAQGPHLHFQLLYRGQCTKRVPQSRLEPISGYRCLRAGRWYRSDNRMKGAKSCSISKGRRSVFRKRTIKR